MIELLLLLILLILAWVWVARNGRLPNWAIEPVACILIRNFHRLPQHVDGDIYSADGSLYMRQRWLLEFGRGQKSWGIRVHHIVRSDQDRALHDHPWPNASLVLRGAYDEHVPELPMDGSDRADGTEYTVALRRTTGALVFRNAYDRHRLVVSGDGAWSLFFIGRWQQPWGFYPVARGAGVKKVYWREYLSGDRE